MHFIPERLYHVYNRGNNKNTIFFNRENYLFFLGKVRKHLLLNCYIIAYCLMPDHFHMMIYTKENLIEGKLNKAIAVLLRSYTRAVNIQEKRSGYLFQQKTKAKYISMDYLSGGIIKKKEYYPLVCFNYIHQNPLVANLITKMEDWEFSSFRDYLELRKGTLCNKELAYRFLDIQNKKDFYRTSYNIVDRENLNNIL